MSNQIVPPPTGLGIAQGVATQLPHDASVVSGRVRFVHEFEMPNGRTAEVGIGIGLEGDPTAGERRAEFLRTVYPPSLTESLEKEVHKLGEQFRAFDGYDSDRNPKYLVSGREREVLEMKLANRINALNIAWADRRQAEAVQEATRAAEVARHQRIEAAAAKQAEQIAEEAEIKKRAEQIARQKHGVK